MEANEIGADLDRTEAFLQGGVQGPGIEEALRVIEVWEQRLAASESPELVSIAENLASLRIQLLTGNFDPAALGQLLVTLGEQTRSAAASGEAEPVADRLSRLSVLLADQGDALAGR